MTMTKTRRVKDIEKLIFPETIPQERGCRAQYATGIISCAIFMAGCFCTPDVGLYISTGFFLFIIIVHLAELYFRIALIFEERHHVKSRYDGSYLTLLTDTFTFSRWSTCLTPLSMFFLFYIFHERGNPVTLFHNFGAYPNACTFASTILASRIFNLDYGPLYQSILITKLKGLDYGSAMAYSYFHGYLEIVLPHKGTEQKGVKELMQDFESKEQIKFEIHKLLILIPLSLYSPTNIAEGSKMVELSKSLPEIRLTRAGVRDRIYKNTVYKIQSKYYVCAEYVTLLQTFYDIVSHNNTYANCYKKHSKELVLQFYLTLQNILRDNPDCGKFCELLFFDDIDDEGKRIDVGQVILNHLRQVKAA